MDECVRKRETKKVREIKWDTEVKREIEDRDR